MPDDFSHAHLLQSNALIELEAGPLTPTDVEAVAQRAARVVLSPEAIRRVTECRKALEATVAAGGAHYGVNTGFGSLARHRVPDGQLSDLQHNLIRSHAAGLGEPLPADVVRGMMLLLAASLCRAHSGVRPELPGAIVALLNAGITPVVPSIGSVGASGDLAPLAHLALVLIGEGEAFYRTKRMPGDAALREAGVSPITLEAKEGLALINGTHLMASEGALLVRDFDELFDAACCACAMSIDAMKGSDTPLDPRVHRARNQPGPAMVAERLAKLLSGSQIRHSHREDDPRVQDPYSMRCAPPVLGAAWDAADYVKARVDAELSAVTDNPLVFPRTDGKADILSAGNFHGMPMAIPLDTLAIAISHIAGIAERRVYLMLAARDPEAGLAPYLASHPGLQSGLMIAQYTAAACCNEIVGLCTPASPANIPTSAGVEDYNSFGPRSAAKARRIMDLARHVVAIELLCASQAMDNHRPLTSGEGVERAHAVVRSVVPHMDHDRPPSPDIAAINDAINRGEFLLSRLLA